MKIAELFNVQKRFLRSTQIERDFRDPSALDGYVVTDHIRDSINRINAGLDQKSGQRSWRITGDYGSGKSSFALLLAHLYSRREAQFPARLKLELDEPIAQLKVAGVQFLPILVSGSREPLAISLLRAMARTLDCSPITGRRIRCRAADQIARMIARPASATDQRVVSLLDEVHSELVERRTSAGMLIVLDELGKFLEYAAFHPERQDVFLLQQLAEMAARSRGSEPLFLVGLLHQGFAAYAEMLSQSAQREWEKVAGRFEELLFDQPLEQIVHLVTSALNVPKHDLPRGADGRLRGAMREAIDQGWYGASAPTTSLCQAAPLLYPIHPTALPVLVKFFSRWGQNERSLFSFLLSNEPAGLLRFAQQEATADRSYRVHHLYDYASANFSHRLSTQSYRNHWNHIDSLVRSFPVGGEVDLAVLKTVGLLNLINSPELAPTEDAVVLAVGNQHGIQPSDVRHALQRLHKERHVLYLRGKAAGYCLWSHTSINLDAVYDDSGRAVARNLRVGGWIKEHLDTRPIVARRHYIQTGNLRCFDVLFCEVQELEELAKSSGDGADGRIMIPLCETAEDVTSAARVARSLSGRPETLIGITEPLAALGGLVQELERWNWIARNTAELKDDRYATEEVTRQLAQATQTLERRIQHYLGIRNAARTNEMPMKWYHEGSACVIATGTAFLSHLSDLCDDLYPEAPCIHNELVNRRAVSSSAALARTRLIERIFKNAEQPLLGMDSTKKPPEMAIYMSILEAGRFHRRSHGQWKIVAPDDAGDPCNLLPALRHIDRMLRDAGDARVSLPVILDALRRPPYGVRDGLLPLLLAIYLRINWHRTALYEDGNYLHEVAGLEFVQLAKEPEHFAMQQCSVEGVRAEVFHHLAAALGVSVDPECKPDLLDVVRPLVKFIAQLPDYSRRTRMLSAAAVAARTVLLEAREPSTLIFRDLPQACGFPAFGPFAGADASEEKVVRGFAEALRKVIVELQNSYDGLLDRLEHAVLEAFEASGPLQKLRDDLSLRCSRIQADISDVTMKPFVFRLMDLALPRRQWLESLGSLLTRKPPERWNDQDEVELQHQLTMAARRLIRVEAVLFTSGMKSPHNACRLVMTRADGGEVEHLFQWTDDGSGRTADIERELAQLLQKYGNVALPVAAKLLWKRLQR